MNRFIDIDCSLKHSTPVDDFHREELVSLEQALQGLQSHIDQLTKYITIAKEHCHYPSEHQLTKDQSASIYLYTMEWGEQSLHRLLNRALRNEDRQAVKIWFPFLKLFDTALQKLPTVKETLWRGSSTKMGKNFHRDQRVIWSSFSSCSRSVDVIKDFLGNDKNSTLFCIESINGKQIGDYSEYRNEEEVIFTMGGRFRVKEDPLISSDEQDVVHLIEIDDEIEEEATASSASTIHLSAPTAMRNPPKSKYHKWKQQATTVAGGNGRGEQLYQLSRPSGICVDQNKSILIADSDNHRIVRWEWQMNMGTIVAGGNGEGNRMDQLNKPSDVIVDKDNHSVIIADQGNRRVIRWFDAAQSNQEILINNIDCRGLAMDRGGFLYVSDDEKHEVRRWKEGQREGTIVAGGNGRGNQPNQLSFPSSLFVDDEQSIYVSDQDNHRVMKWRKDAQEGVIVAGGNGEGNNRNQLSWPEGVLVDRWGQICVADSANAQVMRWRGGERKGEIVVGGNRQGKESNQLSRPTGLSFDDEGNLYVADFGNHRIQKFDLISPSTAAHKSRSLWTKLLKKELI